MKMWFSLGCRDENEGLKRKRKREDENVEAAVLEWSNRHGLNVGIEMRSSGVGEMGGGVRELGNRTETYDDMLRICWSKQDCSSCLNTAWMKADDGGGSVGCSWCPGVCSISSLLLVLFMVSYFPSLFVHCPGQIGTTQPKADNTTKSQTCIPNPYSPPLFAPFHNPDICPLWYERWELRTKPLGCYVSTITFLSVIVTVISTLLIVGILVAIGFGIRRFVLWNREEINRGWWKVWRWRVELRDLGSKRGGRGANGAVLENERAPLLGGGEEG
ncbi:hypothetical protein BDZ45DRAFT_278036 [Acephala macrosclerotiorum]|nr:hypothetical protein BDZ45DRAFT_278036 [Acephala macrosclerotiorum]